MKSIENSFLTKSIGHFIKEVTDGRASNLHSDTYDVMSSHRAEGQMIWPVTQTIVLSVYPLSPNEFIIC